MYRKALRKKTVFLFVLFICTIHLGPFISVRAHEVESYLMCSNVNPITREPVGISSIFFTDNNTACFWVNITDIYPGRTLRFDWFDPDNYVYGSWSKVVETSVDGQPHDYYIAWNIIEIKGKYPEEVQGLWTVYFYIDNVLEASLSFEIVDPKSTYWRIKSLLESIKELKSSIDKVTLDYEILLSNYTLILTDYNSLRYNYTKLVKKYVEFNANYSVLLNDYIKVQGEYDSVLESLNATRMMMYASLGFGILSFAGLIIFVLIGRWTTLKSVSGVLPFRKQKLEEKIIDEGEKVLKKDIMKVRGIGPKYAEKLSEIGIASINDLVKYNPKYLADKINVSREIISRWIENAEEMLLQETQ